MNDVHDIRVHLETILANNPDNDSVKAVLEDVLRLEQESTSTLSIPAYLSLVSKLRDLQGQGLWDTNDEQGSLLKPTSLAMRRPDIQRQDYSIVMPQNFQNMRIHTVQISTLPPELLERINEVYLLHSLATHPAKVLPPGKSLLSIFSSRSRHTDETSSKMSRTLRDQVSEAVTRAFWDEALESLSSPSPAVQLSRLRLLYTDICTLVAPLLPSSHPIIYTLSNPLSPTSSPLRSATGHIRALLSVLRERCSPIRDAEIDDLLLRLADPSVEELPRVCIEVIRGVFKVAEQMKDDLADFVIGTWTEQDAIDWIRRKAVEGERGVVLEMFSVEMVRDSYQEWLEQGPQEVVLRLMKALGSSEPVSPFPPSNNLLPPPFIFTAFDLVKVQNLLQALVIVAALRTLVPQADNGDSQWLSRVWTLLEMEVDRGGIEPAETKLLNLEDEVIQAARIPGSQDAEGRLRDAVRRTLRLQDPVFELLQSRLLAAIQGRLTEEGVSEHTPIPTRLRSGRGIVVGTERDERPNERDLLVKGFDDAVLKEGIKSVVIMLRECLLWTEEVWGGIY